MRLFLIYIFIFLSACSSEKNSAFKIDEIEGYYRYLLVDSRDGSVVDTLYSCVRNWGYYSFDTLQVAIDLLDNVLISKHSIIGMAYVGNGPDDRTFQAFHYVPPHVHSGLSWSIQDSIQTNYGPWFREFSCLSTDSTVHVENHNVKHLTMIEQRDWVNVGDWRDISVYGFDRRHRIAYYRNYIQDLSGRSVRDDHYCLILDKFKADRVRDDQLQNKWHARNSDFVNGWIGWVQNRDPLKDHQEQSHFFDRIHPIEYRE